MKYINKLILNGLCIFSLLACDYTKQKNVKVKQEPFYTNTGGLLQRPRIPLIKPYELLRISSTEWRMELQSPQLLTLSVHNVKGVNIFLNKIILFSEGGTELFNKQYDKAWFIIEPDKVKESAYNSYSVFLHDSRVDSIPDIKFKEPDEIYRLFQETGRISW